ncbi:MAG: DUF805 domain-containing protein [Chromatiaceae bacterium]|jgi:uncharacterized membrane protein YhaH (DUF805 family)|nr:DUF805 domain-containing protein [Chromatiaceae bacterium]
METTSPYRPPTSDIRPPTEGGNDLTPPYSPAGRFGRLSYIAWVTIISIAGQLITLIFGGGPPIHYSVDPGGAPVPGAMPEISPVALAVSIVVGLIMLVIGIIFAVRRCHDIEISGWWNLLIAIPVVNLLYMLFLIIKSGTDGPNRFGPARVTPGWEKVVGIIGIVLFVGLFVIGVIAAIAIPAYLGTTGAAG